MSIERSEGIRKLNFFKTLVRRAIKYEESFDSGNIPYFQAKDVSGKVIGQFPLRGSEVPRLREEAFRVYSEIADDNFLKVKALEIVRGAEVYRERVSRSLKERKLHRKG